MSVTLEQIISSGTGLYGGSGTVPTTTIAILTDTLEFGGSTADRCILNNPVLQLKTTASASTIEVINAGSGNMTTFTDPLGGKNSISLVLGATAGASALNTSGGAWTINQNLRMDKSGTTNHLYTNNGGNGLGLNGRNGITAHIFIEDTGEVGIGNGTNTPLAQLHVKSDASGTSRLFQVETLTGSLVRLRIDANGNIGMFGATPVPQAAAIANASGTDAVIIDQIRDAIKNIGITL